tara:strand:+ start:23636 stop:23998 length:363 start_codon:yes stop_codon:yes gene_type:complete
MSFQTYCEDILDLHTGLMSAAQIAEARASFTSVSEKEKVQKHKDAGLKLPELIAKVDRLAASQQIATAKAESEGLDTSIAKLFVAQAAQALAGKAKKADLLNLITLSSEASRALNNQRKG